MREFLKLITRSRVHAAGTAVLSLLLPPFGFVAAALVGLVTLKYGIADGALILAASVAVSSAIMMLAFQSADPALLFAVSMGLPVLLLAAVLQYTNSQGTSLATAGVLGGVALAAVHLLTANPVAWWRGVLEALVFDRQIAGQVTDPAAVESLREAVDKLAPLMAEAPAGIAIGAVLVLFLSRWAHAVLDNPGGFGKEFRALRLDKRVAYVALGLVAGAIIFGQAASGLLPRLLDLVIALYVVQGVAVAHALVNHRRASKTWLVTLYLVLVLAPPLAIIVLSVAGFSDTWVDYRARFGAGT